MINKKKHFSVVICVCCIVSCSEIFISQDGVFSAFYGLHQHFLSRRQSQWWTFVNTSLISQCRENVSSFDLRLTPWIDFEQVNASRLKRIFFVDFIYRKLFFDRNKFINENLAFTKYFILMIWNSRFVYYVEIEIYYSLYQENWKISLIYTALSYFL